MAKENKAEYWVCIIGSTFRGRLKDGADSPMRNAVESEFEKQSGHESNVCWSGWGQSQERVDVLNTVWSMQQDDPLYEKLKELIKDRMR